MVITDYSQDGAPDTEAIVESDQSLLLERGVSVARGIVRLKREKSHVPIANFTDDNQHLNKGASIAFLEDIEEESVVITVTDFQGESGEAFKSAQLFYVNPMRPKEKQEKLRALLHRVSDCFSSISKLGQAPLAKH